MPSDKRNSITAKATGLIFSLFDIASARDRLESIMLLNFAIKFLAFPQLL